MFEVGLLYGSRSFAKLQPYKVPFWHFQSLADNGTKELARAEW